uniref:hypothetical protein n=1 Tax=Ahnfeltia fastigiata TaxID=31363 RepID=UPI001D113F5D|nr:hypothetical protein LK038_pgp134 [Ahnfeltia fastigiata]UAT97538.1 hypothetical protein Ahn.fas.Ore.pt_088 [Ahnfeltia fastigiata]
MNFEDELKLLLKTRHLFIYILTDEEERIEYLISKLINNSFSSTIYYWDFIDGYQGNPSYINYAQRNPLEALEFIENMTSETPKIFVLRDFSSFIHERSVIRKIRNLSRKLRNSRSNILILTQELNIPILLKDIMTVIEFSLPSIKEIHSELIRLLNILEVNFSSNLILDLAIAYKGLPIERIRRSMCKLISSYRIEDNLLDLILEEKKQIIKQTEILEFYPFSNNLDDIGGLDNLKNWLKRRSECFSNKAINYGLPSPKGVLLVGIQGTGKSLSAKAISREWKLPLLRLDIGKLFAGIVGESEARVRMMIRLAEASSPCILWIDEIDKAFSGINNNRDSGTTSRVFVTFLTWLSEKKSPVFVVATANNCMYLRPELLRKGRFDEIFFLDLPNIQERNSIFKVHLMNARPLTWHGYDLNYLSSITEGFSGAEIQQSIIEGMHKAFYEKREFITLDIVDAINDFIPLSFTDQVTISELQQWANLGKVRLASKPVEM